MLIRGKAYRTGPLSIMQTGTLRAVKQELGFGWGHVMEYLARTSDDYPMADALCDDEFLAWIWAWWLNADGDVKWGDVLALTVEDIEFTGPEEAAKEPDDEADPTGTASTGTGPDVDSAPAAPAPRSSTKSSKTSSKRSSSGSR